MDDIMETLINTICELLEALDAPTPDSCDCGGSDMCAICNAYKTIQRIQGE